MPRQYKRIDERRAGAMQRASNNVNRRLFNAIMYVVCLVTLVFVMWYINELWRIEQKASPTVNQSTSSSFKPFTSLSVPWLKRVRFKRAWKKMQREESKNDGISQEMGTDKD